MAVRLILLAALGALIGGQINRAVYRWAWNKRSISPWSAPPPGKPRRTWADCIPIIGWWALRREADHHGRGFWIRPLCIELFSAVGLASLYWWEVAGNLLPPALVPPASESLPPGLRLDVHAQFFAHAILFALMMVATFIDIDEKTIPDQITIPGTLTALLLAVVLPSSLLPVLADAGPAPISTLGPRSAPLLLTSPSPWSDALNGRAGLSVGLFFWFGWCYGLLPKTIWTRYGWIKAVRFLFASILRHPWSAWIAGMGVVGCLLIALVWYVGGLSWQTLLSALVGLGFGGGLVWAIRVVAGGMLGQEAMGFGDVTLMAMIGAFLGWQPALITFFLAPFTSLLIALSQWLMTGRKDIPFGPFLCTAAGIAVLAWSPLWHGWGAVFGLGIYIPLILVVAVALMAMMLWFLQLIKRVTGMGDIA